VADHSKWRNYEKKEDRARTQVYTDLFPRICEKMREDPVRLIEIDPPPRGRSSAENNAILVPLMKEVVQSRSLFVERRRYPR